MTKAWWEYPGAFNPYGHPPNNSEAPPTLIQALRIMERLERKQLKKQMKKEEEEKKKKDEAKKKEAKMPTFDIWQLMLLGPIVGFTYLFVFNTILQKTVELLHIH